MAKRSKDDSASTVCPNNMNQGRARDVHCTCSSSLSILVLKAFLDDESNGTLPLRFLDYAETAATEIVHLFLGAELIGFLQLREDTVEVRLFSRFPMIDCGSGDVQRPIADRTYKLWFSIPV